VILLVDNYDSFTWNIVHGFLAHEVEVEVVRNDALSADEILARAPEALVLGPGPGRPAEAGVMPELLARAPRDLPILGVCLGHQALVESLGGTIERDLVPVHGRATPAFHDGDALFEGVASPFPAGRYHSLRARRADVPRELAVIAWTAEGVVMGVRHLELPRFGVQFHPDSVLTPDGPAIFANFLRLARASTRASGA
jgi:anthranilate synthase/aminodeoxychorismate synthase-like glutamine amidotransferase